MNITLQYLQRIEWDFIFRFFLFIKRQPHYFFFHEVIFIIWFQERLIILS